MIKKIKDIWNFEEIINNKIKKYEISEKFYKKEEEKYIFNFKDTEIIISENEFILNKERYLNLDKIKIFEKYFLFKKYLYINSVVLKENINFKY